MEPLIVFCNFPDADSANAAAETVVTEQLAACVNILPESSSIYRWEGRVMREREVPALIKTTSDRYPALEARLRELHPAQVPEIIAVPVWSGLPAYLQWLGGEHPACGKAVMGIEYPPPAHSSSSG